MRRAILVVLVGCGFWLNRVDTRLVSEYAQLPAGRRWLSLAWPYFAGWPVFVSAAVAVVLLAWGLHKPSTRMLIGLGLWFTIQVTFHLMMISPAFEYD